MKILTSGAEHHFLTFLEKLKANPTGWIACTFAFSKRIVHEDLVTRRAYIKTDLERLRAEARDFADAFARTGKNLPNAYLYLFSDTDIILLCCPKDEAEQAMVRDILEKNAAQFPKDFCDYGFLTKELYVFQKLADYKMLTQKKMCAYEALGKNMPWKA